MLKCLFTFIFSEKRSNNSATFISLAGLFGSDTSSNNSATFNVANSTPTNNVNNPNANVNNFNASVVQTTGDNGAVNSSSIGSFSTRFPPLPPFPFAAAAAPLTTSANAAAASVVAPAVGFPPTPMPARSQSSTSNASPRGNNNRESSHFLSTADFYGGLLLPDGDDLTTLPPPFNYRDNHNAIGESTATEPSSVAASLSTSKLETSESLKDNNAKRGKKLASSVASSPSATETATPNSTAASKVTAAAAAAAAISPANSTTPSAILSSASSDAVSVVVVADYSRSSSPAAAAAVQADAISSVSNPGISSSASASFGATNATGELVAKKMRQKPSTDHPFAPGRMTILKRIRI